jgi:GDPmannose 4,6-dehydratase
MKYLITGITGQDGIFLSNFILNSDKENEILGVTRSPIKSSFFKNLKYLKNDVDEACVDLVSINLLEENAVLGLVENYKPDFIFNLSGPSSVYNSYNNPEYTYESITKIFENLTKACQDLKLFSNFFQPSSSEMFKNIEGTKLTENSEFEPLSPYAKAKHRIHNDVIDLRERHGWNISSGILFNHESEFRKDEYLFMKIITTAIKIRNGSANNLTLGSLDLIRDWSYAKDVAEAMFTMTNSSNGDDYVIGSGKGNSIRNLVEIIFQYFNLDFMEYVQIDETLLREKTPDIIISSPEKIKQNLGWESKTTFNELVLKCIEFKLSNLE